MDFVRAKYGSFNNQGWWGTFVFKRWSSERFGDPKAKLDGLISNINMLDLKEEMMVFLWRWHVREKN